MHSYLARTTLYHDVLVLAKSRALLWESGSGTRLGRRKVIIVMMLVSHFPLNEVR